MDTESPTREGRGWACRTKRNVAGLAAVLGGLLTFSAAGASLQLGWDGGKDPSIAGYTVYYGSTSGNYTTRTNVGATNAATITGLIAGSTNYFAVAAYNVAGVEGTASGELAVLIPGGLQLGWCATNTMTPQLKFSVLPGHAYSLQAATEPGSTNWITLCQVASAGSNTWISVVDTNAARFAQRFYRLAAY